MVYDIYNIVKIDTIKFGIYKEFVMAKADGQNVHYLANSLGTLDAIVYRYQNGEESCLQCVCNSKLNCSHDGVCFFILSYANEIKKITGVGADWYSD
jgi:hypothetical protein